MPNIKKIVFHPAVLIPSLLILFLGAAALTKTFIWPVVKKYQAQILREEAAALLEQGNYSNAFIEIRKALFKDSQDLESYKIGLAAAENSQEHYHYIPSFLQELMKMEPENPDHFYKFILFALRTQSLDMARDAFSKYPVSKKQSERYHQIGYSLGLGTKDLELADFHLEKLLKMRPDDDKLLYTLSSLRLRVSKDEDKISDAKEALTNLAAAENSRLPALRVLLAHSLVEQDAEKIVEYIEEFGEIGSLGTRDRLLILQAQKTIDPENFREHIDQFLDQEIQDPLEVTVALDFLIKNELLDRASSWAESLSEDVKKQEDVKRKISQIYYLTENWSNLRENILDENWAQHEFGRYLLLALTSKIQSDPLAFRKYWQQCLIEIGSNREYLKSLFQTTASWGWEKESIEVLEKSFHEEPTDDEIFNVLANHFMSIGETSRALEILGRRVEYVPDDLSSKNNFALLSILTDKNHTTAFTYARKNFESDNENPYFVTTWAFALQKLDRLQEAAKMIEWLPEVERNDPRRAVYMAKIFFELGNHDRAREFLERVAETPLFAEEKNLLMSMQKTLQQADK